MQVYPNQFQQHLERNGLPAFVLIFGEENQQKFDCIEWVRSMATGLGFEERQSFAVDKQFNWQAIIDDGMTMSLFSSKKLVEIEIPDGKPGAAGSKILVELSQAPTPDTLYVIHGGKIGRDVQNTKWFKSLDKNGFHTLCYPLEGQRLEQWISQRFKQQQLQPDYEVVQFMAGFCEGNLMAAAQEIEKLALVSDVPTISLELVKRQIADHSKYTVFQLVDTLLQGNSQRAIKILTRLESEGLEANQVLWFLVKETQLLLDIQTQQQLGNPLNQIFTELRIWKSKQALYSQALNRLPSPLLMDIIEDLSSLDLALKSSTVRRPYIEISHVILQLCGFNLSQVPLSCSS